MVSVLVWFESEGSGGAGVAGYDGFPVEYWSSTSRRCTSVSAHMVNSVWRLHPLQKVAGVLPLFCDYM